MRLQGSGWYGHDTGTAVPIPGMTAPVGMDTAYQQPNGMNDQQWRSEQLTRASYDRRRQESFNASSQVNSTGRHVLDGQRVAPVPAPTPAGDTPVAAAFDPATAESFILMFTNRENEFYFTTGEIYSTLATKAQRAKVSSEGIDVQTVGGGRGPFMVVVNRALGELIVDDEEIELIKLDPGSETVERALFEVSRRDAQGRAFDDGTKERVLDVRRTRRLEENREERDRTIRVFIDGNSEMLVLKTTKPEEQKALFVKAVEYVKARIPSREKDNYTIVLDDVGREQNTVNLFVVRPRYMSEADFLGQISWSELKYAVINPAMNPCKVRVTRELSIKAGIKSCCFMPDCQAFGRFECGARSRAMQLVRLPSNFTFERDNSKRERQAGAAIEREENKKRLMEMLGVHAKSPNICRRYRQGRCTRHMFCTHGKPADSTCEFTHGDLAQTMEIPCKAHVNCEDLGCPYFHPPARQERALDEHGAPRTSSGS